MTEEKTLKKTVLQPSNNKHLREASAKEVMGTSSTKNVSVYNSLFLIPHWLWWISSKETTALYARD